MRQNIITLPVRFCSLILVAASLLCACKSAPEADAVTSKNSGTFETALQETVDSDSNVLSEMLPEIAADFTSSDEKINYSVDISEATLVEGKLPVLQVTPHVITENEAERVARALFGDSVLYEYTYYNGGSRSKSELENEILKLEYLLTEAGFTAEYPDTGFDSEEGQLIRSSLAESLEDCKEQYQTAGDSSSAECEWTYYPEGHYYFNDESLNENSMIMASCEMDGQYYTFSVTSRDRRDYRIEHIAAYFNMMAYPGPDREESVQKATTALYTGETAAKDAVDTIYQKASDLIVAFGLGTWNINSCEPVNTDDGYYIRVSATPVYEGVAVSPVEQLETLKSDDAYATNYYYSEITLSFAANGTLIDFSLISPLDEVAVLNENVSVMNWEEFLSVMESKLSLADIGDYPNPYESVIDAERVDVIIDILTVGFTRTRIKNNDTDFYLLPTITLQGAYTVYGTDGSVLSEGTKTLLTVNAVDSTAIDTALGY